MEREAQVALRYTVYINVFGRGVTHHGAVNTGICMHSRG